ncbi:hypothetical protein CBM2625_B60063 [Cupriavidus taiwanensis]|nr:hypothetical protein CBM2625_B60063 [Cupriavidus taiwanensis]
MDGELRKIGALRCGAWVTPVAAGFSAERTSAASTLQFRSTHFHSMKIRRKSLTARCEETAMRTKGLRRLALVVAVCCLPLAQAAGAAEYPARPLVPRAQVESHIPLSLRASHGRLLAARRAYPVGRQGQHLEYGRDCL